MSSATHKSDKPLPTIPIVHIEPLDDDNDTNSTAKPAKPWRPVTLRWPYLSVLILITVGLIATIQWLLYTSTRDQGIIFAKDINDLPLRRSFSYMYLPTIISVIYSFLWTWIDLDIKRLEPWFQLSKDGGASGANSVLLSYPLEFLVTLPFTAFKRRHWSVLSAAMIMILVFWGLTPIQAGIFATRTITLHEQVPGMRSTQYKTIAQQGNLTADYAQSVYNIAWLNETLPAFMTKDYVLAAFGPNETTVNRANQTTYAGLTSLYSVDVSCQEAILWNKSGVMLYNSTDGCRFGAPRYRPTGGNDTSKPFDTLYAGYQNDNGFASYYLSDTCTDEKYADLFFIRWSKSTLETIRGADKSSSFDPAQAQEASLFCRASYYQQSVNATISLPSSAVLGVETIGGKSALPSDMFNISTFEWAMNSGQEEVRGRGDFPTSGFPDQKSRLADMPLNLVYLPKMSPFAIAAYQRPLEDYLIPENLRLSYQAAYRLLFSRQMVDILGKGLDETTTSVSQRSYKVQAVVVVPGFAYATTTILFLILLLGLSVTINIPRRANSLRRDPATIGALMDLVAPDPKTAEPFSLLDCSTTAELEKSLCSSTFQLQRMGGDACLRLRTPKGGSAAATKAGHLEKTPSRTDSGESSNQHRPLRGIRPAEMKLVVGALFFALQLAAFVTFLYLYIAAKNNDGLPLPSKSTFVRQLVQNYIPIALGTFMEPFWLVLIRLLSLLQPMEELREGISSATQSVDLNYSSLPPQVLFARAARARHFLVMLICLMAILANVLSVALSGLMYEGTAIVSTNTTLPITKQPLFRSLNGTGLPFNTNQAHNSQGGTTSDQFYREMSNLTAHTPLPPWSDNEYAYAPVGLTANDSRANVQLNTTAFGAELNCEPLPQSGVQNYSLTFSESGADAYLNVSLTKGDGSTVLCRDFQRWTGDNIGLLSDPQEGHVGVELGVMLATNVTVEDSLFCRQHILAGWIRADWQTVPGEVGKGVGINYYSDRNMTITSRNDTMLLCKPKLIAGPATIIVDGSGRVQKLVTINATDASISPLFTSTPADLIAQANQFIADSGSTWHTDSYPSDFLNYLIKESTNDTSLLDVSLPVPSPAHASKQLASMYTKLFAMFVGSNIELLLEDSAETGNVPAQLLTRETRILISTPAFIVAEAILGCYLLTTIFFYVRRPWRVLPRLPGTIASYVAHFAASHALQEIRARQGSHTGSETKSLRSQWTWAYGNFVGTDRQPHTGIDRQPFVTQYK